MNAAPIVHQRNHRKRLFGWIAFYIVVLGLFIAVIYFQAKKVNTLELPTGHIQLLATQAKYTVGDTVGFTIRNNFSAPIYLVNKCPQMPLHVYEYKNDSWQRLTDQADAKACAGPQTTTTIAPGASLTKNYAGWPHLFASPGIYRLVAYADNYPDLAYTDFQVVAPPPKPLPQPAPVIIYKPVYTPVYTPIYIPAPAAPATPRGGDN